MALTNFAALTTEQLTAWSRDFWRVARNASFINQFAGSGSNNCDDLIQQRAIYNQMNCNDFSMIQMHVFSRK